MKYYLQVGQVFRCKAFGDLNRSGALAHKADWVGGQLLRMEQALMPDHGQRVQWTEHEEKDGWHRQTQRSLDLRPTSTDLGDRVWTVTKISLTGGGTAHGPHDVYPDGHHVWAQSEDGTLVDFSQSGCFVGMLGPREIDLIRGDDVPGEWARTYVKSAG